MVFWLDNPTELLNFNNEGIDDIYNKIALVLIIGVVLFVLLELPVLVYIALILLIISVIMYHTKKESFEPTLDINKKRCTASLQFNLDKQVTQFLQPDIVVNVDTVEKSCQKNKQQTKIAQQPAQQTKQTAQQTTQQTKQTATGSNKNTMTSSTNQYYTKLPYQTSGPTSYCNDPVGYNADDIEIPETCKITVTPQMFRDKTVGYDEKITDRIFETEMNHRIPNNQTEAAKWIYGLPPTCKEGDQAACFRYEDLRYINHLT